MTIPIIDTSTERTGAGQHTENLHALLDGMDAEQYGRQRRACELELEVLEMELAALRSELEQMTDAKKVSDAFGQSYMGECERLQRRLNEAREALDKISNLSQACNLSFESQSFEATDIANAALRATSPTPAAESVQDHDEGCKCAGCTTDSRKGDRRTRIMPKCLDCLFVDNSRINALTAEKGTTGNPAPPKGRTEI